MKSSLCLLPGILHIGAQCIGRIPDRSIEVGNFPTALLKFLENGFGVVGDLVGYAAATYLRGEMIFDKGAVQAKPGSGRFLAPERAAAGLAVPA